MLQRATHDQSLRAARVNHKIEVKCFLNRNKSDKRK